MTEKLTKKRILIAPLDWGLGHATRCIPLINLLLKQNCEIIVAADGSVAELLQKEFPGLVILRLKGYGVRYSNNRHLFFPKILVQFPRIIAAVKYEKKWLGQIITKHRIDAVISDNRFGLYTNKIPCVFITHQLFIRTGNMLLNKMAQKINYSYINKFVECWVPDMEGHNNLAGELSHPSRLPGIPVKYLGVLSRFEKKDFEKKFDLLIMLSGPEPQRSIFENILLEQLKEMPCTIALVRGLPLENKLPIAGNKSISIFNHLPADELNELIQRTGIIVARCGYSTVMDLVKLKQPAILVPTPGQAEQEYLAGFLHEKKIFFTISQENFSLKQVLRDIKKFEFSRMNISTGMNENIILEWLKR